MVFILKHLTAWFVRRGSLTFCITYRKCRCVKGAGFEGTRVNINP